MKLNINYVDDFSFLVFIFVSNASFLIALCSFPLFVVCYGVLLANILNITVANLRTWFSNLCFELVHSAERIDLVSSNDFNFLKNT